MLCQEDDQSQLRITYTSHNNHTLYHISANELFSFEVIYKHLLPIHPMEHQSLCMSPIYKQRFSKKKAKGVVSHMRLPSYETTITLVRAGI